MDSIAMCLSILPRVLPALSVTMRWSAVFVSVDAEECRSAYAVTKRAATIASGRRLRCPTARRARDADDPPLPAAAARRPGRAVPAALGSMQQYAQAAYNRRTMSEVHHCDCACLGCATYHRGRDVADGRDTHHTRLL